MNKCYVFLVFLLKNNSNNKLVENTINLENDLIPFN